MLLIGITRTPFIFFAFIIVVLKFLVFPRLTKVSNSITGLATLAILSGFLALVIPYLLKFTVYDFNQASINEKVLDAQRWHAI